MRQLSFPRPQWAALFVAMAIAVAGWARPVQAAGLLIADGGQGGVLSIKEHSAHVTINNGIAVTTVTQVFLNTEDRTVEALYTFPVPRGASVANFSMWINGKEMTGEVVEKERARQIYNSYKAQRRDPGLLEQVDFRTFEMRVFPIAPRAEQKVQVTYYQELDFDHDWATYVYPLATQTRKAVDSKADGKFAITVDVKSEIPITEMKSPSHQKDFAIAKHTDTYEQASLETKTGDLSKDVVLAYHISRPHTGIDLITAKEKNEDGYFSLTLTAGEELAALKTSMDYVFVMDISGSMTDDGKLESSQKSLSAFIESLDKDDHFEVMTFNNQPHPLFGKLQPATDDLKKQAATFLATQEARGGTILAPAINAAYKYDNADRPLNVVILSDGLTEQNERAGLATLIKNRPANGRVFTVGVGNDVNRALLESIANDSGGLAAFISRGDDFTRQAQAFQRKLQRPVATDLALDFGGVKVYDVEPIKMPNLFHGQPVRIYGRYKGDGTSSFKLTAKVMGHDLAQKGELAFPKVDDANPEIERMWAWHRVDRLLKDADNAGDRSSAINEIVRLGEGYSIATEYTSFIVLENDNEFQRWHIDRKNALRIERDKAAEQKTDAKLAALRDKATLALGPVEAAPANQMAINANPAGQPMASSPAQPATPSAPPEGSHPKGQNFDFTLPTGGGGAIDPLTGLLAGGFVAAAWMLRKGARRKHAA